MDADPLDNGVLSRRGLLALFAGLCALFFGAPDAEAGPRHGRRARCRRPRHSNGRRARRCARVRRRAGQRVRRPFVQETTAGRSLVVVPVDIDADDTLVLENNHAARVVEARPFDGTIVVEIDGRETEFDAQFRGAIGPRFAGS